MYYGTRGLTTTTKTVTEYVNKSYGTVNINVMRIHNVCITHGVYIIIFTCSVYTTRVLPVTGLHHVKQNNKKKNQQQRTYVEKTPVPLCRGTSSFIHKPRLGLERVTYICGGKPEIPTLVTASTHDVLNKLRRCCRRRRRRLSCWVIPERARFPRGHDSTGPRVVNTALPMRSTHLNAARPWCAPARV